ncbi:MAG: SGNH/GDSL hydrolase family protein [Spirochaetia bacterium]|nr:SGNH/GDSL hydrolase family protein [Spirochaetia bacterium]
MNLAHLLEAGMLVCFGFSWPLNVVKAYRAKTARGTSLAFIILIITGYIAGISAKIINNQLNYVLGVYFLNLAIVSANVFVYIRNKRLDKKSSGSKNIKIKKLDIKDIERAKEEIKLNYTNSLDELINGEKSFVENKNAVILFGGTLDKNIPVADLSREYNFNFDIYNKSCENITLPAALEYFKKNIAKMIPEGIIIHLGENDISLFQNDSAAFDNYYLTLLDEIKAVNKDCRIALISINNPAGNKNLALMNAHINAIAQTEKAVFINLENAKLWNPEATKAANEFAYAMGLKIRKPLRDVAEIFYSYAFHSMNVNAKETLVG